MTRDEILTELASIDTELDRYVEEQNPNERSQIAHNVHARTHSLGKEPLIQTDTDLAARLKTLVDRVLRVVFGLPSRRRITMKQAEKP